MQIRHTHSNLQSIKINITDVYISAVNMCNANCNIYESLFTYKYFLYYCYFCCCSWDILHDKLLHWPLMKWLLLYVNKFTNTHHYAGSRLSYIFFAPAICYFNGVFLITRCFTWATKDSRTKFTWSNHLQVIAGTKDQTCGLARLYHILTQNIRRFDFTNLL